ncbi:uncharacterized protein Dwil_GK11774 [Drosophila willistoni]|uniref:NF-kappa-B-repressing factor n=1 Tax=Drosophila willistoni TaxID=7260 RepID=B4NAT6_DROWI|nr:uncharacterized protein LOC6647694 [Drosophila willistoni]EDW80900.2 uncharacterized protein Dwil_GK11774 [Drosophila willistoni]
MASKPKRQRIIDTESAEQADVDIKKKSSKKKTNKPTENMGEQSISEDWDVDDYRTEYESDEHWELRRSFMEAYKNRFDEQQLVCLAQTFVNMEFLGCKYPSETMHLVAELSKDIAEDFRRRREQRLKRTFVSASDAAEQRAKGRKNPSSNRDTTITADQSLATINRKLSSFGLGEPINLFQDLRFGKLIIQLAGGRNCLRNSCSLIKAKYDERVANPDLKPNKDDGSRYYGQEILINDEVVATGWGDSLKTCKLEAFKQALIVLQSQCYSYKINSSRDTIKVEKDGNGVKINVTQKSADNLGSSKLDESNKGYNIMRLMGWTGGGLGRLKQGREEPVGYLLKSNRTGFGSNNTDASADSFRKLIENYAQSSDIRDLQFEPTFSKDERAILHKAAGRFSLRSSSYGTGEDRRLLISKKIPPETILKEVLIHRNPKFCERYFVQVPTQKAHLFPGHAVDLALEDLSA